MTGDRDLSFLARPDALADWRMTLSYDCAAQAGVLAALPGTAGELAFRLGLAERPVGILCSELEVWGLLVSDEGGHYALGEQAPTGEQDAVLRQHAAVIRQWAGGLSRRLHDEPVPSGEPGWHAHPEIWLAFLAANARRLTAVVAEQCLARLPRARRVLDLGGGHGEYALELRRRGLQVTMQDRPHIIELADRDRRLTDAGIELFAGDFFQTLPAGPFDLVLCAGVTNTFGAERNRELYRRLDAIIAPGGAIAIATFLRDRNPLSTIFAVQMMVVSEAGDAHSEEDYRDWLGAADFASVQVLELEDRPQALVLATR